MPEFSDNTDWVSFHLKTWRDWLAHLRGRDGLRFLELGSYEGRSAIAWCREILTGQDCELTCVDVWWQQEERYQRFLANVAGLPVRTLRMSSHQACAQLTVGRYQAHVIYVDADHHGANVLADMCWAWPLLRPGGVMICDDYTWTNRHRNCPPGPAIDAWLAIHRDRIQGYEIQAGQVAIWKPGA